ncbi:DUF885 domain-containing protein [Alteromonas oceanisediminis]|uniref:DUF885 domain-containing protein n=1 Tax=Alteromonas oceanisediminis TaxID=2836180 RepID=UPI001BD9230E|nr:DUF885 domain-containing protein [Alteromonas oceanisediminis]MBT0587514.1 DUF885 family protein [Alteromonas oceanisediminis]
MKNPLLLSAVASALLLSACSPAPQQNTQNTASVEAPNAASSAETPQTESEKLAAFFERTFEEDLRESPMRQSYLGLKWDYDKWDDISTAAVDERVARQKARLKEAEQFDTSKLSEKEQLSLRIFQTAVARELANDEFRLHTYIMHQFRAFHTMVPSFLINIHRVNELSDAEAYVKRLEGVDDMFDQVIQQLKLREELGVYPPKWAYDQMIQASNNVISGNPFTESVEDSTIYADFKAKLDELALSNAEKSGLLKRAQTALLESVQPAYEKLIAELQHQQTLSPEGDGVWRLPDGEKWYENRLAWFTTTSLDAEQVHQLGLDNVERIHTAMRGIMEQVNFDGTLQEFFEFMRSDDQFYYENTDAGRDRYMQEAKAHIDNMREKIPEYFGLIPEADMIIKRVEPFREKSAGKAFYQSPSKDGTRPGIYYANLYDMRDMPIYQMEALAYHEGIPGHHMQRAIAQELDGIPEFQKYASFTAYTEGWGLYTEELGKDMGFYKDPYSDFGRLAMELWRACRLVVDTGIHAKQWSREKAIDYLIENPPNPQNDAVKAIERYIAMPGQATAYMIGKLKIMELRERAQTTLGDAFDWRGFHDEILKDGPVPLSILEEKVDAWIETQR